jgi:homoserine O-acetyltransferase
MRCREFHAARRRGGHASAGGTFPADVDFLNSEISTFFDVVTAGGQKIK